MVIGRHSILFKLMLPMVVMGVLFSLAMIWWIPQIIQSNVVEQATKSAQKTTQQFKILRGYYVKNLVSKVKKQQAMKFGINHADHADMLPLPATMIMDLSQEMEKDGVYVSLYSQFPFPNRSDRQLDGFQQRAWERVQDPAEILTEVVETQEGRSIVRVGVADTMSAQGCVSCHNAHPDTPKRDWKLGQTRGVLEVKLDITEELSDAIFVGRMVSLGVMLMVILSLLVLYFTYQRKVAEKLALAQRAARDMAEGKFDTAIEVEEVDEVSLFLQDIRSTQEEIGNTVEECVSVMDAIGRGRFDQRVSIEVSGQLDRLKQGINASSSSVDFMMRELGKVMRSMFNGDFSVRMDSEVEGEFRTLVEVVEETMNMIETTMEEIMWVMDKMQSGEFQHRVKGHALGDLGRLKEQVNASMDALEGAMVDITRVVQAQAEGDMTQVISADYRGELHLLKEAVNATAEKLSHTISEVVKISDSVSSAAHQVATSGQELSQRTSHQAATLEETAASMEEMTATVQHNTDAAQQANELSQQVRREAEESSRVVKQAMTSMETITAASYKISEIITLIDGIAFQTNLLALNAAVEAARAGDHGRGFAVVAGEVRGLAQKSAEASKDIKTLIEDSVTKVDEGSRYVVETGGALDEMHGSINKVSGIISEIALASSEQQTGINQVNNAVSGMDRVTQQNAAAVEESSAAADQMNDLASHMKQLMSFFQTRN